MFAIFPLCLLSIEYIVKYYDHTSISLFLLSLHSGHVVNLKSVCLHSFCSLSILGLHFFSSTVVCLILIFEYTNHERASQIPDSIQRCPEGVIQTGSWSFNERKCGSCFESLKPSFFVVVVVVVIFFFLITPTFQELKGNKSHT